MICEHCDESYDDRDNSMGYGDTKCPHCGRVNYAEPDRLETSEETDVTGTNAERPFEKGDVISYAGDLYEVVTNDGDGGTVKALMDGGIEVKFRWVFEGEAAKLVKKAGG